MTRPGAVGLPSEMEPIQGPFYSRKSPNMPAAGSRPASAAACSGTPASRRLSSRRATPDGSSRAVWAVVEGGVGGGPGGQRGGLLVRPRPAGFPAGEPRRPVVPRYRPWQLGESAARDIRLTYDRRQLSDHQAGHAAQVDMRCDLRRPETRRPGAGEGLDEILAGA